VVKASKNENTEEQTTKWLIIRATTRRKHSKLAGRTPIFKKILSNNSFTE
jgi:hypothetical protein